MAERLTEEQIFGLVDQAQVIKEGFFITRDEIYVANMQRLPELIALAGYQRGLLVAAGILESADFANYNMSDVVVKPVGDEKSVTAEAATVKPTGEIKEVRDLFAGEVKECEEKFNTLAGFGRDVRALETRWGEARISWAALSWVLGDDGSARFEDEIRFLRMKKQMENKEL